MRAQIRVFAQEDVVTLANVFTDYGGSSHRMWQIMGCNFGGAIDGLVYISELPNLLQGNGEVAYQFLLMRNPNKADKALYGVCG